MSLSVSTYTCNQEMATLCAFRKLFYQHLHHGIVTGNVLLPHICMRAIKAL